MLTISPNLPDELKIKIKKHIPAFELLPGVVIIHDVADGSVAYLSPRGLALLNTTIEEIAGVTRREHGRRRFNNEDTIDDAPHFFGQMNQNGDDEVVTFFQQMKLAGTEVWNWHLSSLKVFCRDESGKPRLLIGIALPLDATHHLAPKAERLVQENAFLRKNYHNFRQLTAREKEILRLTALGKSASEISAELFIAETTAETHRRNLKSKLQVSNYYQLSEYARAFNLI